MFYLDNSFNKSVLVCPYNRITIGCPSGLIIKINSAYWGRREKKKCTYASVKPCGVDVTKNLITRCDSSENCGLRASPTEPYLSNVCQNVHKYLEVDYACTTGNFLLSLHYTTGTLTIIVTFMFSQSYITIPLRIILILFGTYLVLG